MVSRGFRHAHAYIQEPKFRRFRQEKPSDLLPWADPYIASLFSLDDEQPPAVHNDSEPPLFNHEDEEENNWRR